VALTAAQAERDYRRVIVEYPLAYYRDDALLSIAELEQARGDRAGALAHLQRYVHEHAVGKERGTAALGAARLAFEQRDIPLGCSMLAEARRSATAADIELRNQIEAYGTGRCTGQGATTSVATQPLPSAAPGNAPAAPPAVPVSTPSASAKVPAQPRATPPTIASTPKASVPPPVSTMQPPSAPKTTAPKSSTRTTSVPTPTVHAPAVHTTKPASAARSTRPATSYTVQLAAYDTRPPAEALVAKLATRGVKARVSGTSKPFRVRLGFYRTPKEAAAEVAALKKRHITGFVAQEIPPREAKSP
jgi:hypothetical protein